jgi:hypothetical protein
VEFRPGDGLYGNLHFNPKHELAEQLAWDAEHNPRNVGFSHNVLARLARDGDQVLVEAITHVQSVDLVADPAATQGLFEQLTSEKAGDGIAGPQTGRESSTASDAKEQAGETLSALTYESLLAYRPDLLERHARDVTAPLQAQLQEAAAREAAQRARPRSTEQRNVLARGEAAPPTARDFARAITARPALVAGGSRRTA